MLRRNIIWHLALALCLGLLTVNVFAGRSENAQVSLSFEKQVVNYNDGVLVKVGISNPGKQEIRILRWLTPADGVKDDLFAVTVDGKQVEYIGADYKRPAPTEKDYLTLKPGESIATTIDLSSFYDFSESGLYQVNYKAESFDFVPGQSLLTSQINTLKSDSVAVWIEGRETKIPAEIAPDAVTGSTSYTSCTTSRQSSLLTARNNASTYAANSYNYLNAGTIGARYTTWFGTYNSSRYSTVRGHYLNIRNAMDTASVRFNCSCTDSAYAYVYPTQPYTIYLCNAFWSAPSTGTDSKAGTLVHEMSHFNVVASTDDWAYGQSAAKSLAISNPKRAVDNADSHEYFAENTPAQP